MEKLKSYQTPSGLVIERREYEVDIEGALEDLKKGLRVSQGALFASGYEYPGRYNRWDIGFFNPPVECIAYGREIGFHALNEKGQFLLVALEEALKTCSAIEEMFPREGDVLRIALKPMAESFSEEERSRQPSLFSVLRQLIATWGSNEDDVLGFYGAFGYDLVFQFEPIQFKHERGKYPDAYLYLPDEFIVVDRRLEKAHRIQYDFISRESKTHELSRASSPCHTTHTQAKEVITQEQQSYADKVQKVREGCQRGDFFEVVLSQTFSLPFEGDAFDVFDRIQKRNPSPYEFLLNFPGEQLVGASPEMFVRVEGKRVETCPISGTVARGRTPMEDADQIKELLSSEKEESELTMCTDVDRNDKSRVCRPGSIKVLGRRLIEMYSRVIHTVDHVEGILSDDRDSLDAFLSHLWAVTVSGAPKPAALQTIEDLEESPRRWFGGAIGGIKLNGDINTGITIRTVHLEKGVARVRVGATLLAMSDPKSEERETELKAEAFLKAVTETELNPTKDKETQLPSSKKKVLFVDHRDSFVHTLASYVRQTGAEVLTMRSGFSESILEDYQPDLVFLSPGPFTPSHFGLPEFILNLMKRSIPTFGVCLGMQGMVEAYGGALGVLPIPRHGVKDKIEHQGQGVFKSLPNPLIASRYHSLYAIEEQLPKDFEITAKSSDGIIMGVQHRHLPLAGVQFHPESIHALKDDAGIQLVSNAIHLF